jgi:hypothetical protein
MLSFASVIVDQHGQQGNAFEACLEPLPDARSDPDTLAWLQSQPEVWADATRDPLPAEQVIQNYVQWIRELPTLAVFVAHPLAFDGFWIDWYLRRFAGLRLVCGPYGGERLFLGAGLDLPSLLMGVTGWDYTRCRREYYPEDWYGGYRHTHRAIDDGRGIARRSLLPARRPGSPRPQRVVETRLIRLLLESGAVVVCAGGGGVPVIRDDKGQLRGVEAVVDKDLTSAVLAESLDADVLLVLTDVPAVMADFGTPDQRPVPRATPAGLRALNPPAGSMGPKVDAVCRFVELTGGTAAIGSLDDAAAILRGEAGTIVTPSGQYDGEDEETERARTRLRVATG